MALFTTAADERAADHVWEKFQLGGHEEVICLNPGAAFGAAKFWHAEYFTQAREISSISAAAVYLSCAAPTNAPSLARSSGSRRRAAVCTVAEEALSIGLTKALIRRADLLVTTDSGPRHFAAAFERPVVTLFGPTHISWTETYYSKAINLQMKVPCGPCQKRVCPLDHRCMTELLPQDVFAAVNDLMSRSERGQPLPLVVTRSERKAS